MARLYILHVEDHPHWRNAVATALKSHGYCVVSCPTMRKALKIYSKARYDWVIVDGSIDQLDDGFHWAMQLHDRGQKVVSLTGNTHAGAAWPQICKESYNPERLLKMLQKKPSQRFL